MKDLFISDAPVKDPKADRFKRWPFSRRVAQTIAARRDPSSFVVGIYGEWGSGKTTVLNFIEKELNKFDNVICIKFNPWRYVDEVHLLTNFFNTLQDVLGKCIASRKKEIGELFSKYGFALSLVSSKVSDLVKGLGESLSSSVELDDIKFQVENILNEHGKRLVIIMDDIDRLDKTEIQAVFKLVKVTADFSYTSYILAFDDEMVAAALGERYGAGNMESGRRFLEKIIQVGLNLPVIDPVSLRNYCFRGIEEALLTSESELTEDESQRFVNNFVRGLEIRLHTPRMAKRYQNTLTFALPILKGEVNKIDLMLIEGIRVFYPTLYSIIRDNPDAFLGKLLDSSGRIDKGVDRCKEILNEGLMGLTLDEQEAVKSLLRALFPRLKKVFDNTTYGPNWDEVWAKKQYIASSNYFHRYFTYSIPEGDFSDVEFDSFLDYVKTEVLSKIVDQVKKQIDGRNAETFVYKLRSKEKQLSPEISYKLALALAQAGHIFPNPEALFSFMNPFSQTAILISRLLENITDTQIRFDLAKELMIQANPIEFALECFRWIRSYQDTKEEERLLDKDDESQICEMLVSRIKELAKEKPLYIQNPKNAPFLLYVWATYGLSSEVNEYIKTTFNLNSNNVIEFLKTYVPTAWAMNSGLPHKSDFSREQYNSIVQVMDAETIFEYLKEIYGSEIEKPQYRAVERDFERKIANQFAYIHLQVTNKVNDDVIAGN